MVRLTDPEWTCLVGETLGVLIEGEVCEKGKGRASPPRKGMIRKEFGLMNQIKSY